MDEDPLDGIAEDDPLEGMEVQSLDGDEGGTEAIPEGYARVRASNEPAARPHPGHGPPPRDRERVGSRVLVAPEVDISVDPSGERPDVVHQRGEFTEQRLVAPIRERSPQPDSYMSRALDYAADRLRLPRSVGGFERPSLSDVERFADTGSLNTLFQTAPRPEGMSASAPDHRDRAGMYGLAQGLSFDHLDEASGLLAGVRPAIESGDITRLTRTPTQRDRARDAARGEIGEAQQQDPDAYDIGGIGGALPYALMPGGQRTMLGRLAAGGGTGLVMGGLRGEGQSEGEGTDALLDAGDDAAFEGAIGAATAGMGEVAAPLLRRLGPWAARLGSRAQSAGVQSRLEGTGIWGGSAMRAADQMPGGQPALASDLRRLGIGAGVSQDASRAGRGFPRPDRAVDDAAEVMDDAGEQMQGVLSQMDDASAGRTSSASTRDPAAMRGMVDVSRAADELERVARQYDDLPVGGADVANAIRSRLVEPLRARGAMRFGEAHQQRRLLDDMIRSWQRDPNLATSAGQLQTARRAINDAMNEAAESLDPALRQRWQQANRDYSVGAFVRERGRGAERLSVGGGIGTQAGLGLQTMVENMPGGGAIQALGGGRELAQQQRMMWPGIRARALEALAPRLQALGARGQQWAAQLQSAQQRGQRALAATHYALSRTDPEYRAATEQLSEQEQE